MSLVMQLEQLKEELNSTLQDKGSHDKRLVELDELVMQLINLNEVLISKLTESNTSNVVYKKILGIPKKSIEPAPSSDSVKTHVRSRSTSATRFSSFGITNNPPVSTKPTKEKIKEKEIDTTEVDEDVIRLHALHKMYKGLARVIMENRGENGSKSNNGTAESSTANRKKKVSSKHFTEKSSNHEKPSYISAYATPYDPRDLSALTLAAELRQHANTPIVKQIYQNSRVPTAASELDFEPYPSSSSILRNQASPHKNQPSRMHSSPLVQRPSRSPGYTDVDKNTGTNATAGAAAATTQVQKVITSIEEEFEALSSQYRRLLMSMQRDPAVSDPAYPVSDSMRQSDELTNILQQLQRKGEQLRTLRGNQ